MSVDFDVIVIGAGHAGIEACLVTSRLGLSTAMITSNRNRIGYMSCNPAIGGLGKGQMVREVDILGGEMGRVTDLSCIQFKRLNSGKGPAVRGSRAQCDKDVYSQTMTKTLESQENLRVIESEVKALILEGSRVAGVTLQDGSQIKAKAVIITTGTFMNGVMHVGFSQVSGGRVGDKASVGLSDQLISLGFDVRRLKTGTPPRLLRDSIDWSKTTPQLGDQEFFPFSVFSSRDFQLPQVACFISRTTERTHEIIRNNLDKSPMYCGLIEGSGPRYCPSIEDKIVRFADKLSHQTFLEPEGLSTDLIYLQGISSSLPEDVQQEFLQTIPGLENVKVARYGYAVEYDFIEPTQIKHSLETREIGGLYLAGQVNGTSGYEEAAAQGFMAGVNAVQKILGRDEFVLKRHEAYIGVLIDDLVTKGTVEPYRMFTSRAEHRLILREDNTLDRLANRASEIGIGGDQRKVAVKEVADRRAKLRNLFEETIVYPKQELQQKLLEIGSTVLKKSIKLSDLVRRSEIDCSKLFDLGFDLEERDPMVLEALEIELKYQGYISRHMEQLREAERFEGHVLPESFDYVGVRGLSNEEREKLTRVRPRTLGQAQRISGVNPSAIQAIMVHLKIQRAKAGSLHGEHQQ